MNRHERWQKILWNIIAVLRSQLNNTKIDNNWWSLVLWIQIIMEIWLIKFSFNIRNPGYDGYRYFKLLSILVTNLWSCYLVITVWTFNAIFSYHLHFEIIPEQNITFLVAHSIHDSGIHKITLKTWWKFELSYEC